MILVTSNKLRQLLCVSYIAEVVPEQLVHARADVLALLGELSPGFRLLVNLSQLKFMNDECATEIGAIMEQLDRSGVSLVVRVIPDESKDIGFNILAAFHYPRDLRIVTCQKMTEAARVLEL